MAHSKGPWARSEEGGTSHIRDADGTSLMADETYYPWCPSNDDDWNLIAAAPEMLQALKSMRGTLVRLGGSPMPSLDAVIAKAEGISA